MSAGYAAKSHASIECERCEEGTYSAFERSAQCTECPLGQFQAAVAQMNCTLCPVGYFQNASKQSMCHRARAGVADKEGSTLEKVCAAGTFMNVTASICSNCLSGQYSDDGLAVLQVCLERIRGFVEPDLETPCSIGKYMPPGDGQVYCVSCPEGFYQGNLNATACSRVDPGYRASTEKPGAPQQIGCPKGKYSRGQSVNCTPCLTGTYQDNETSSSCAACPTGWVAKEGSQKCDIKSSSTDLPVPKWKSSTTSGEQLSVVYEGDCNTTRIYYANSRDAKILMIQQGPVLRLNRSGWQEVLYTKALCETSSSLGTFSDVTESWTVASDCDEGYLQVYEDESKRKQFRQLRPKNGPVCRPCPFGAACLKDTVGTEASLRPKPGYWRIPWSETFGECAECLQEEACNTTGCIYPYTGPLCAMCEPGFTRGPGRICAHVPQRAQTPPLRV